jgi:two-component system chemotaxis sensor kinase CheA
MVVSRDASGKPLRLVGTNSDITERKLIEAELVHSKEVAEMRREQVANLLDNSGQGFLSFGVDLVVQAACSRACETMLGQYPAGQDVSRLLFGEDEAKAELLRAIIPSVLAQTDPDTRESMLSLLPSEIHRDHVILKAEYRILDKDQFMLVLTDITAERRMAAMLERERHRLELIVKAVSDNNFFETVDGFLNFSRRACAATPKAPPELYWRFTPSRLLNQFSFPTAPPCCTTPRAACRPLTGRA